MVLPDNPTDVAEGLVAALRDGRRTPQEVLSGLHKLDSWDLETLEALVHELREANHAGRLSDHDFGTLRLMLSGWLRTTPDYDPDATEELEVRLPAPARAPQADPAGSPLNPAPGLVLRDRYRLGDAIARGGQSVIYRARDLRREASAGEAPDVAVKVLRDEFRASAPAIARLKREFRQTQSFRHAGIVRMYDLDCDRGVWFISMELLAGTSLANRLNQATAPPLDRTEARHIATACADVLAHAHRLGTPHGDFKPGNVFLEESGGIKVLDFGAAPDSIATPAELAPSDASISPIVSHAYASPEVLAGQPPEPRDDLFSFACVVYELISGRHPFDRLPANAARDASLQPQPLSQLSAAQNAALASALAWTRAERPPTVGDLMLSLLDRRSTVATRRASTPAAPSSIHGSPRWRWMAGLVAVGVLAFILRLRVVDDHASDTAAVDQEPVAPATNTVAQDSGPVDDGTEPNSAGATGSSEVADVALSTAAPTRRVTPRNRARIGADSASIPVSETASVAVILLHRQGDLDSPVQVAWRLSGGSAKAKEDFDGPLAGTARFLSGQATSAIFVPLINDSTREGDESFTLSLSPRSAAVGPIDRVTITIRDDD